MVRSYRGYYCGLSIRLREFDSPTHRQVMRWIGYCGWKGTATPQTGSIPVRCAKFLRRVAAKRILKRPVELPGVL